MSATIRSSVRPASSKQPWGTILKPSFGLGYQRLTKYELKQTVNRLHHVKIVREREFTRPQTCRPMSSANVEKVVARLTANANEKASDCRRTQENSIYKNMGVVNSYAWKGYN